MCLLGIGRLIIPSCRQCAPPERKQLRLRSVRTSFRTKRSLVSETAIIKDSETATESLQSARRFAHEITAMQMTTGTPRYAHSHQGAAQQGVHARTRKHAYTNTRLGTRAECKTMYAGVDGTERGRADASDICEECGQRFGDSSSIVHVHWCMRRGRARATTQDDRTWGTTVFWRCRTHIPQVPRAADVRIVNLI